MKGFEWMDFIGMTMISVSVGGWLVSFLDAWGLLVASIVGISVIAVNYAKYKGIKLDNERKRNELKGK